MPMLDWREEEATNETVFRAMNEWGEDANDASPGIEHRIYTYLCECSDLGAASRSA
jgi:hypothetical protein